MRFLLAMGLHQLVVAHDFPWLPAGKDSAFFVYQDYTFTYLQDKLKVMSSH
jgi:hypothetical protein